MTIVGIAGPIAAGKSELSKTLAAHGLGKRASFGTYVREVATARGLAGGRVELQRLGEELLAELGAPAFVDRALADIGPGDLVVDGVRHLAVSDALAARADRYLLVFVELEDTERQTRLRAREGGSIDLETLDAHSTEREVPLLRDRADVIVDGDASDAWRRVVAAAAAE